MSFYHKKSRKKWSDNALAKKERLRIERAKAADQKIIEEYEMTGDKKELC